MPFETQSNPPRRIAVIGGGISGMAAAYLLKDTHHVTLFESEPRLGGHARTKMAGKTGDRPVDTGFIVFNNANYPNLVKLFRDLDVPVAKSDMSFGASVGGGAFEYGLKNLRAVFAQPKNAASPKFLRMIRDIMRFNKYAKSTATPDMSIRDLLAALGTGEYFRDYYLLPLSGAIWSTPLLGILDFPATALVQFFENHALLDYSGQHQWYTVEGGSIQYVARLQTVLENAGVDLRLGAPIGAVRRDETGVHVTPKGHATEHYDEVVFATHSDISLSLLEDPDSRERAALSAVRYQPNHAVLHSDPVVMPKRKSVWASWVYTEPSSGPSERIALSYWMNSLQPIPMDDPLFVTLNGTEALNPRLIHDEVVFTHPVYDLAALDAQRAVRGFNGARATWYCGAWMRNGFHEDGFASARDVVDAMATRQAAAVAAA